jgi:hypothetical protein
MTAILLVVACAKDPWADLRDAAEQARELEFVDEVPITAVTPDEWRDSYQTDLDPDYLDHLAQVYGRLGYFDPSLDLTPIFADTSDLFIASYDPGAKTITVIGDPDDDVVVHELVHALQDQHFGLYEYDGLTSDQFLARRAVTEGDAVLSQYRYQIATDHPGLDLDAIDWEPLLAAYADQASSILADSTIPLLFDDYAAFCYANGLPYTAHNVLGVTPDDPTPGRTVDMGLEDELFTARPPNTTEHVLRLGLGPPSSDDPVYRYPWVPEPGRGGVASTDVLGEFYAYLLLYPVDPDARELVTAWDGDVLEELTGDIDKPGVVWASVWDDDAAAAAVARDLALLHGMTEGPAGTAADGEAVYLEARGRRVFFAKNVAIDDAPQMADGFLDDARPPSVQPWYYPYRTRGPWPPLGAWHPILR